MVRAVNILAFVGVTSLSAQGPIEQSAPRFEVASIKPWSPPTTPVAGIHVRAAPAGSGIFNRSTSVPITSP